MDMTTYLPSKNYEDLNDVSIQDKSTGQKLWGEVRKNRGHWRRILATCSTQRRLGCSARAKGLQRPEQIWQVGHIVCLAYLLSGHETCEKDNVHYLVVNHIQSKNTDGVFDFLTTTSPISDVVARRHWKWKLFETKLGNTVFWNMSRCRMASFSLKWVHGRGVAYRRCTSEKQRVDKNNILRPLSWNNMRSVLEQGLKILPN